MADYRVIAADLRSGLRIAELPINDLSFGSVLNGAGELSGSLPLPSNDPVQAAALVDAVDPVRRQIIVERDGVVVWCGIVWVAAYDDTSQTVDVRAGETWSYYRKRIIGTRRKFVGVDQLDIVQTLLEDAHAVSGGDIGVTVGTETSGVDRDRTYETWEFKNLGEAVEQLAEVIDGFDFSIDAYWTDAGTLGKALRLWYPRKGRRFDETGHVFEVGRNIISWDWPLDGTRYANQVRNVGAGQDAGTLRVTRTASDQLLLPSAGGPGYPLIEDVISNTDVLVAATLTAQADLALNSVARPVVIPSVTVRADLDPIFGAWSLGDACRIVAEPGITPYFPNGLDDYRRIIGFDVAVSDDGEEEVQLVLGVEDNA
jgi:hypothetical protein